MIIGLLFLAYHKEVSSYRMDKYPGNDRRFIRFTTILVGIIFLLGGLWIMLG